MAELTVRQEKFAKNVGLKDMTYSDAYRDAYKEDDNVKAYKLFRNSINEIIQIIDKRYNNKNNNGDGWIYIINQDYDYFSFKIGKTKSSVKDRLRQLQTGNPNILELSYSCKVRNVDKVEKEIHSKLKYCNILGEWFLLSPDKFINIVKEINSNK